MSLKFKFIPLTFLKDEVQIKYQIRNTIILRYLFDKFNATTKLEHLISGTQYGYNASALKSGHNKFLRISDITDGKVNWNDVPYCDCTDEKTYLLHNNDLLIARTGGTTGKSFLISNPPNNAIYAGYLIRIQANNESNPEFINLFLNSYIYWSQIVSLNKGEFRPSVNAEKLKSLIVPKVNINIQNDVVRISIGEKVKGYESLFLAIDNALSDYDKTKEILSQIEIQKDYYQSIRQAFLQEAIEGKLTENWRAENSDIEPASELLKRIKAEKAKGIKEKNPSTSLRARKEKELAPISKEEIPFEIPKNWRWCRFKDIVQFQIGKTPESKRIEYWEKGVYNWLNIRDMEDYGFITKTSKKITSKAVNDVFKTQSIVEPNTLLMSFKLTVGKTSISKIPLYHNEAIISIFPFTGIEQIFLFNLLPLITEFSVSKKVLMGQTFNSTSLSNMVFPLPPTSEQSAIVEKVETLMAKCTALEQEITQSEQYANMLMQAVLKEAFESNKERKVIQLPALGDLESSHFVKRKMLASYIINQSANDEKFGDTKFEKLLHLTEYHLLKRNFGQEYKQKAAGPYDNKFTVPFFQQTIQAGWFYKKSLGNLNRILPGKQNVKSQKTYDYFSDNELQSINGLIETFKNSDYQKPEIISTLYAVWNNRIIQNQEITDELLKQDFLAWDKGKAQYVYPEDRVTPAIKWMNDNNFIPNGWGKVIEAPKSKAKIAKRVCLLVTKKKSTIA